MRTYTFYTDPGHGWLKVPYKDLQVLGIDNKITKCSFVRGAYVYLEEDCDGSLFVNVAKQNGWELKIIEKYSYKSSKIRSYDRYYSRG